MANLTNDRLRQLLSYDEESGLFRWIKKCMGGIQKDTAGWTDEKGYIRISIDGKSYRAHRLVFLYMEGSMPIKQVDHINRVKNDNRFSNLRLATNSQNRGNLIHKNNTSGKKGVSFHKLTGKWQARIHANRKMIHLGLYQTPEEAHKIYCEAAKKHYGEYFYPG